MRQVGKYAGLINRRALLQMLCCSAIVCGGANSAMALDWPVELVQPAAISPYASVGLFNDITRAGSRLVAVGERGRIMLSDDNGLSWRQVHSPVSTTLICCRFASAKIGWISGQMGVVLKTADAGESWSRVLDGFTAAYAMVAEAKADAAKPVATPSPPSDGTTPTELQNAQFFVSSGTSIPLLTILPLSETHLLVFGGFGLALESFDGGVTWTGIAARVPDPNGLHLYAALQAGDAVIAVGEQGLILRGLPGGVLKTIQSPFSGSLFGLLPLASGNQLAFGLQGAVLLSADDGITWQSGTPATGNGILAGVVLQDQRIVLGDEGGNLLLSSDAGHSFKLLPVMAPVTALAQAADQSLVLGSPIGLHRLPFDALERRA
jgi:photosystem II stability/assembly factor-like uncharacterized protein